MRPACHAHGAGCMAPHLALGGAGACKQRYCTTHPKAALSSFVGSILPDSSYADPWLSAPALRGPLTAQLGTPPHAQGSVKPSDERDTPLSNKGKTDKGVSLYAQWYIEPADVSDCGAGRKGPRGSGAQSSMICCFRCKAC